MALEFIDITLCIKYMILWGIHKHVYWYMCKLSHFTHYATSAISCTCTVIHTSFNSQGSDSTFEGRAQQERFSQAWAGNSKNVCSSPTATVAATVTRWGTLARMRNEVCGTISSTWICHTVRFWLSVYAVICCSGLKSKWSCNPHT